MLSKKEETQHALQAGVFKAVRYLEERYDDPPSGAKLAEVAGMSRAHFHRVFREVIGDSVNRHVMRLRVERAASMLTFSSWQIGEVALICGFKTQASFGREFKRIYEMTPRQFRAAKGTMPFLRGMVRGKQGEVQSDPEVPAPTVHVEAWPEIQAICFRHYGRVEDVHQAWQKLISWSRTHVNELDQARFLGLWFDDWSGVRDDQYRYECAIVPATPLPENIPEPFFLRTIPAGNVAVSVSRGTLKQLDQAWFRFATGWFPCSGYQPRSEFVVDEYEASLLVGSTAKLLLALGTGITLRMGLLIQDEPLHL